LENSVGHSLNLLDIVLKIWARIRNLFAPLVFQAGYGPEHFSSYDPIVIFPYTAIFAVTCYGVNDWWGVRINFDGNGIFQKPTWHLNSSTNLSLTIKTYFNSIQNCRPTPEWYSTVFVIWGW